MTDLDSADRRDRAQTCDFILSAAIRKICSFGWQSAQGNMAIAGGRKTIGVIGAGMIGVTTASFLLRRGHDIVLLDPGEGTSFGNAGCFNGSSVVPMSMPGIIRSVPKWLADPLGPLVLRLCYCERPETWVTDRTGHMGNTFHL